MSRLNVSGFGFFCVCAVFALLTFSVQAQNVTEVLRSIELERYEKAKADLYYLIEKDPKNPVPMYRLGELYLKLGNADSARVLFRTGMQKFAKYPMNHVGMGKVLMPTDPNEAQKSFDKAIEISRSKNAEVFAGIAEYFLYGDKKDADRAIFYLDKAFEKDGKNYRYYLMLGDAYIDKKDGTKALENYKIALSLNKHSSSAYLKTGKLHSWNRNYNEAMKNYKKGLELDPEYVLFHKEMADIYYRSKKYPEAIESYKKYVEGTDKSNDNDFRYASFLFLNEDYDNAIQIFNKLKKTDYGNPVLERLLGFSWYEKGDYQKALEYMDAYWKKAPEKMYISADFEYYGKIFFKTGNDSLAIHYLNKALEKDTSRHELYIEIGNIFLQKGNYGKAAEYYVKKMQKTNLFMQEYLTLGKAYYFDKQFGKADSTFATFIVLLPNSPNGYLWRARSNYFLDESKDKALAVPYFEKFIELADGDERFKKELIDSYSFLGNYYLVNKNKIRSDEYWKKVIELDPGNKVAEEMLKRK